MLLPTSYCPCQTFQERKLAATSVAAALANWHCTEGDSIKEKENPSSTQNNWGEEDKTEQERE